MKRKIVKCMFRFFMRLMFRLKTVGKENIPQEGACIICPNHKSFYDAIMIVAFSKRHITMIGKKELLDNPFTSWICNVFGVLYVERNGKDIDAVKKSLTVLKKDELLGIFPEGTRNGLEKGVKPKTGAVSMAMKAGVPIIPVGIKGNYKIFRKVTVTYGKPIYYEKTQDKDELERLTDELMNTIIELTK